MTLRDEHLSLLPGDNASIVAAQAKLIEEFIAEHVDNNNHGLQLRSQASKILLHGHCHQKSFNVMPSVEKSLSLLPDTETEVIQSSCCGMAGSFGYMKETVEVSKKMASLDLVPAIENAEPGTVFVACGTSCRHQIESLCNQKPVHVVTVLARSLASTIPVH